MAITAAATGEGSDIPLDADGWFSITMLTAVCKMALQEEGPVPKDAHIVAFMPNGKDRRTGAPRFTAVLRSKMTINAKQYEEQQVARKAHLLRRFFATEEFSKMKASLKRKRDSPPADDAKRARAMGDGAAGN